MPKVSAEHKAAVRSRLLDATLRLLATTGYHAMSTRDVMREAGLSAGTFYHYFASKDDLMAAAGETIAERELATGLRTHIEGASAGDTLADLAVRLFRPRPAYSMLPSVRTQATHVPAMRAAIMRYDRRVVSEVSQALATAQRDNDLDRAFDPEAVAELALIVFEGLQARAWSRSFASSYERVGRTFLQLLAKGAAPKESRFRRGILRVLRKRERP
jgi:AcrR family transcriptional regulator